MSKIEKSLELNITHEILSLADSFWWFLQPISLKRYWRPHWRFPFMQTPKSFAIGLPIILEGKKGGGFDVCINSPSSFQGGNPRLLFMQFKAGVELQFNKNSASVFYGNVTQPNIHIEFDINNNKKFNQHQLLQTLAQNAGNGNAVVYVFPRIVTQGQLEENAGNLLNKTSFISIKDIDSKASSKKININDGKPHKFRTCYRDWNKNEINAEHFLIEGIINPGKYLGEIFAIRMFRALKSLQKVQLENYSISIYHVMDAMIRHMLNIGMHFNITLESIKQLFVNFPEFSLRFDFINQYENLPKAYQIENIESEFLLDMFNDIFESLSIYFNWIEQLKNFKDSDIPNPPTKYTIEINIGGLRFNLNSRGESDFQSEDLDSITYSLF